MKRKKIGKYLKLFCLAAFCSVVILTLTYSGKYGDAYADAAIQDTSFGALGWTNIDNNDVALHISAAEMKVSGQISAADEIYLKQGSVLQIPLKLREQGDYQVYLEYKAVDAKVMDCALNVRLDGEEYEAFIPMIWADAKGSYSIDRYGNELNKDQVSVDAYVKNAVIDGSNVSRSSLKLPINNEACEVEITSRNQDLMIKAAYIVKEENEEAYAVYREGAGPAAMPQTLIAIEGESYELKSDSFIRGKGINNPVLSPYETYSRKINVIDANSWSTVGQKILWEFYVEREGFYDIGFRYSQYSQANKISFREIELDGSVPYRDLQTVSFSPTDLDEYKNYILNDGEENLSIYLTPGYHTIAMKAVIGPYYEAYNEIMSIMQEISDMGMDLKKMTAGVTDKNRTWDMETYLPQVPGRLSACADRIDRLYDYLKESTGKEPVFANDLIYAADTLRKLVKDPRTLPNKTEQLNEGDNCVSSALGKILLSLIDQPLSIDRIYLLNNTDLPEDKVSVFTSLSEGVKAFVKTFTKGAASGNYSADSGKDSKELQVWVNMSIPHTKILQQLVDSDYNIKHGTNIQLSVMPNEQKLILANATRTNPDVAVGLSFYTPYDFAIRGAAKNLLDYKDFLEVYKEQYNLEGLTPLVYDDGIYGAVDSLNFQVLYYRSDILKKLRLSVPETWDDVEHMMPELLRYSMNFNTTLANNLGFKTFNATGPFLYQNNGAFYAENGLCTAFGSKNSMKGFEQMTELFQVYALQEYVANFFNSFRYGEVPIGISDFSTYVQLQVAAPELTGKWDIAVTPGQKQGDGTINRYQAADSTASMIFKNTNKEAKAWDFLKWWLSEETQIKFSYLLESTYGVEYRWNTANLAAFSQLPYPEKQKAVILQQLSYQKENLRHPAGYMVERESSNIWNNVVANGNDLIESIDRSTIAADREITRKLQEFGYLDKKGNVIKEYNTDTIEMLEQ